MAKYSIILTRDTTESATVEMQASSQEEAVAKAILWAKDNDWLEWKRDDTPNASKEIYATDCEISA